MDASSLAIHYESRAFAQRIANLRKAVAFDLVHVDGIGLAAYLVIDLPTVCVHHNVESSLLRRRVSVEGRLAGRQFEFHATLMENEERRWAPRVTLNVMKSPKDRNGLEAIASSAPTEVIPNGVDVDEFLPEEPREEESILYTGGTNWFPNVDALEYSAPTSCRCFTGKASNRPSSG